MSDTSSPGLHAWLISDSPESRRQARLGQLYRQWLAFKRNPMAVAGLVIIVLLLLIAAFAPLIAPFDPIGQIPIMKDALVGAIEPASGKAYEPVDLNHPWLLVKDGLAPL